MTCRLILNNFLFASLLLFVFFGLTVSRVYAEYYPVVSHYFFDWKTKASMPTARYGHATVTLGDKIYTFGGVGCIALNLCFPTGQVEVYDTNTNTWHTKNSLSSPRSFALAVTSSNGKIYLFGGETNTEPFLAKVEEYNPDTDTWQSKSDMPYSSHSMTATVGTNNMIYIFGGGNNNYNKTLEYNPSSDTWAERAPIPYPIASSTSQLLDDGRIIIMGGSESLYNISDGFYYQPTQIYNPNTDTWSFAASMPPVWCVDYGGNSSGNISALGSAKANNGRIYVIGGSCNNSSQKSNYINMEYDPQLNKWSTVFSILPTGRGFLGVSAVSGGKIYALGGFANNYPYFASGGAYVDIVEEANLIYTHHLSGRVYFDGNANGVFDQQEDYLIPNATVYLSTQNNPANLSVSDGNGNYRFFNLLNANTYTARLQDVPGFITSTPNPVTFSPTSDQTIDFGVRVYLSPTPTLLPTATPTPTLLPTPTPGPSILHLAPAQDTYIKQGSQNENEGKSTFLRLQQSGRNRGLVSFDQNAIANLIGSSQNYSAKLMLSITDNGNNWGTGGRPIGIYRLTSPWVEGNGFIAGGQPSSRGNGSGATWSCAVDSNISNQNDDCSGSSRWNMDNPASIPFFPDPTDSFLINNQQSGLVEFDVTSDVQFYLSSPTQNFGWTIKKIDENQSGKIEFGSKESSTPPELVITLN